ncbi:HepT-like ribonuclease domain-containing protein [Parabacteroides sp.]
MQSIYKNTIVDKLLFVVKRIRLATERTCDVKGVNDFLLSPSGMDLFDATCMRIQTIGEVLKQVNTETKGQILENYQEIPWRKVFAMRNILSHEYLSLDPDIILDILRNNLLPLEDELLRVLKDIDEGRYDELFS